MKARVNFLCRSFVSQARVERLKVPQSREMRFVLSPNIRVGTETSKWTNTSVCLSTISVFVNLVIALKVSAQFYLSVIQSVCPGNAKGGSVTVPLTSGLTGLDKSFCK
jgi:hypothetical protein